MSNKARRRRKKKVQRVIPKESFFDKVNRFLKDIEYHPNFTFILGGAAPIKIADLGKKEGYSIIIQKQDINADVASNTQINIIGYTEYIYDDESIETWIHKMWTLVKKMEDHERDEFLKYQGVKVYDPHNPLFQRVNV